MTIREELEIVRAEPIQTWEGDRMKIPCVETSDSECLCKHPVVSVVMLTYNHEPFIRQAIEGVMSQQTDFEYELLIGEDSSTDCTREICFEYQRKCPEKIRVFWSEGNLYRNPHPAGDNFGRVIARCRGEFIAFCEGDDFWTDPKKLQKQVDAMRTNPSVGFCFAGAVIHDQDTGLERPSDIHGEIPAGLIRGADYLKFNIFGRGFIPRFRMESFVRTATVVVRRSVYRAAYEKFDILNWRLRLGDVPIWLAISSISDVYYHKELMATYRIHSGSANAVLGASLWKDNLLSRLYFWLVNPAICSHKPKMLMRHYLSAMVVSNNERHYLNSLQNYLSMIGKTNHISSLLNGTVTIYMFGSYLRNVSPIMRPVTRLYRRIRRHGEFSRIKLS